MYEGVLQSPSLRQGSRPWARKLSGEDGRSGLVKGSGKTRLVSMTHRSEACIMSSQRYFEAQKIDT